MPHDLPHPHRSDPGLRFLLMLGADDPRLARGLAELQGRWRREGARSLRGIETFGAEMDRRGLRAPPLSQPRARFYFTERGWAQVGRHVAAAARRDGYVVKVIRRKQPRRSQVVYRDDLQVALLPGRGAGRGEGKRARRATVL
ncbi:MAG: hypothetical protein P8Y71_07115 [Pseudolabrys sp.]